MRKYLLLLFLAIQLLFGYSDIEKTEEEDNTASDSGYFFPQGTTSQTYEGRFMDSFLSEDEMELSVTEVKRFEAGCLYELEWECKEKAIDGFGVDRQYLGLFLVLEDRIYFIREEAAKEELETVEEFMDAGALVCSEEGKEDALGEEERGWHEFILVDGNRREYHGYSNLVETGYYEHFVWELGSGLVEYMSGYGAERDHIELYLLK